MLTPVKAFWKSRTVWYGVIVATIPVLGELTEVLKDGNVPGWVVSIIGGGTVLLRFLTGQPIGSSDEK